jgi:xanthine/CO dehydrogenase XdhC/CoxF family maturation factor
MSNLHVHQLMQALKQGPAVLVSVHSVQGSGPREVGAWMAVLAGCSRQHHRRRQPGIPGDE